MVRKLQELPDKDDYVIATITALNPNSAFARLDEYGEKNGLIPVSEVSTTWVKDIRKHLRVGQRVVGLVRFVDRQNKVIHLSVKRVSQAARKAKLEEFENERRAENLIALAAKGLGKKPEDAVKEIGDKLQEKFGLMFAAFEAAAKDGAAALKQAGINDKWAPAIEELAKKTIKPKEVRIRALLEIKSTKPDGIEAIKAALASVKGAEVRYLSSPKYSIEVKAPDYPTCEKLLADASKQITAQIQVAGGEAQLIREK